MIGSEFWILGVCVIMISATIKPFILLWRDEIRYRAVSTLTAAAKSAHEIIKYAFSLHIAH